MTACIEGPGDGDEAEWEAREKNVEAHCEKGQNFIGKGRAVHFARKGSKGLSPEQSESLGLGAYSSRRYGIWTGTNQVQAGRQRIPDSKGWLNHGPAAAQGLYQLSI